MSMMMSVRQLKFVCVLIAVSILLPFSSLAQNIEPDAGGNVAWSPDGTRLVVFANNGIFLFDRDYRLLRSRIEPVDNYFAFSGWSPDGTQLLYGNQILNAESLQTEREIMNYPRGWLAGGQQVFTYLGDRFQIINVSDGSVAGEIPLNIQVEEVTSSPDGNWIVARGLFVFDVSALQMTLQLDRAGGYTWNSDGTKIAFIGVNRTLNILDVVTNNVVTSPPNTIIEAGPLTWQQDRIAMISRSRHVFVWDANTFALLSSTQVDRDVTGNLDFSPYGGVLAIGLVPQRRPDLPTSVPQRLEIVGDAIVKNNENDTVALVIPEATSSRLRTIAAACGAPTLFISALASPLVQTNAVTVLDANLDALPAGAIPPGCEADLRAIAEALQASE